MKEKECIYKLVLDETYIRMNFFILL